MATQALYLEDAYCFEAEAVVVGADLQGLVLDRTCMYPGGGGQPTDTGEIVLASGDVLRVEQLIKREDRTLVHVCAPPPPNGAVGAKCVVRVDGPRRLKLMRYHTALHVFNTVMLRDHDGWITGVSIGPDESHIDFKLDNYNADMRPRVERAVNEVLARSLSVGAYYIGEAEFRNRPDLLRTLEAAPPVTEGRVRVVEIEGFESQACGGTHVRNTSEVGRLSIRKVDNKGRQNRRFYVTLTLNPAN
ncbi:MAG: alanyl-tRNA editing protein [bacterium]